jgi:hypothetical protein
MLKSRVYFVVAVDIEHPHVFSPEVAGDMAATDCDYNFTLDCPNNHIKIVDTEIKGSTVSMPII